MPLLVVVGLMAVYGVARYTLIFMANPYSIDFSANTIMHLLVIPSNIVLLVFALVAARALLRRSAITRATLGISIVFGSIALAALLWLGYGLIKDALGVGCRSFFGADVSCTSVSILGVIVFGLHPVSQILAGVVSLFGIFSQARAAK